MNCIDYLTKNNIKWFPINLQNKVLLPIKDPLYNYTLPTFNDFIDLSDTQIKKRQTLINQFDYIAIDTNDIHMIDFDSIEATNKYNHLLDMPNFKSITKRLPHIFCKFEGDIKQKIQKIKKDNIDYDLLHGQWSYCHKNTIIDNHDKPIKHISFDIFDE